MSNYKKDKSYIKQRLEYVSPVDYISELEGKIEYLEYLKNENERLNNVIDELESYLEQQYLEWKDCETDVRFMAHEDKAILDKLKELKGSVDE